MSRPMFFTPTASSTAAGDDTMRRATSQVPLAIEDNPAARSPCSCRRPGARSTLVGNPGSPGRNLDTRPEHAARFRRLVCCALPRRRQRSREQRSPPASCFRQRPFPTTPGEPPLFRSWCCLSSRRSPRAWVASAKSSSAQRSTAKGAQPRRSQPTSASPHCFQLEPSSCFCSGSFGIPFANFAPVAVFTAGLAALAEAAADTVSSELGQVLSSHPRMITTLRVANPEQTAPSVSAAPRRASSLREP